MTTLTDTRRDLDSLRSKHGARSAIGSRCSLLMEQLENLPAGPEDRIEYLTPDYAVHQRIGLLKHIEKTKADLARLLSGTTVDAEER